MPFYFRKSVAAGPFRFNFSKSGVGLSVGVKGFRLGTGPRGHYAQVGIAGIFYRTSLGRAGEKRTRTRLVEPALQDAAAPSYVDSPANDVNMVEIESGDVLAMREETFDELLSELNETKAKFSWAGLFGIGLCLVGIVLLFVVPVAGAVAFGLAVVGFMVGRWLDSYRRASVLLYDLDAPATQAYENLTAAFDRMMGSDQKWHVAAGGDVRGLTAWKRNSGATRLVDKKPTTLAYALPEVIKSNLTPPKLHVGRQAMYFLPDAVLIEDGRRFGAVSYADLSITWEDSPFIETGRVPRDTTIIRHTWKHPNKSGGPDRRFKDNSQLPICLYETMHLRSGSGVNEAVQFSKVGLSGAFARSLGHLLGVSRKEARVGRARA